MAKQFRAAKAGGRRLLCGPSLVELAKLASFTLTLSGEPFVFFFLANMLWPSLPSFMFGMLLCCGSSRLELCHLDLHLIVWQHKGNGICISNSFSFESKWTLTLAFLERRWLFTSIAFEIYGSWSMSEPKLAPQRHQSVRRNRLATRLAYLRQGGSGNCTCG